MKLKKKINKRSRNFPCHLICETNLILYIIRIRVTILWYIGTSDKWESTNCSLNWPNSQIHNAPVPYPAMHHSEQYTFLRTLLEDMDLTVPCLKKRPLNLINHSPIYFRVVGKHQGTCCWKLYDPTSGHEATLKDMGKITHTIGA